jgi:hypothetical protein
MDDGRNECHDQTGQDTTFCDSQGESVARLGAKLIQPRHRRVRFANRMVSWLPVRIPKPAAIISPACPQHRCRRHYVHHHRDVKGWRLVLAP